MSTNVKLIVGAVLELAEADYMYGIGTLAIRLTEVTVDPKEFRAMEWVEVRGSSCIRRLRRTGLGT